MLLTAILQNLFDGALLDLFSAVFGLGMFLYCLGPGDLNHEINLYLKARENGDDKQAQSYASAIIGDDAYRIAMNIGKTAHQRGSVVRFEFMEIAAIDGAHDDFPDIVLLI